MKSSIIVLIVLLFVAITSGVAIAAPAVIAGSELVAPPAFLESSFWGITAHIDRAFSFTAQPGGPYTVDALQVAAFHYQEQTGSSATFSIREDVQGEPGVELVNFLVDDISTNAQVHASAPSNDLMLNSNVLYWIVGQTDQEQVNWNLGEEAFGQIAYRVDGQAWTVEENRNVSAFAILGTPVPEPTSITLLAFAAFAPLCFRTRIVMVSR